MFFGIFSRNPKKNMEIPKFPQKTPKSEHMETFQNYSAEIPKNFWQFWISMCFLGFSAEIQKNTWKFLDFHKKSKKHMEIFGFSAEIPKTQAKNLDFQRNPKKHMEILDFQQKSKKTQGIFWKFNRNPKKHMEFFGFSTEIQKNTWKSKISKKFLVRPIVLEILHFLKFWYVVTTGSPLFKKLLIKSLYRIISGHVFRIRDLIDF